jgi:hypothetical protein
MHNDKERDYKYIDIDKIDNAELEPVYEEPSVVLFESLLDILQLAEREGMAEEEVDAVLKRIIDHRADRERNRFILHTKDPE